MPVAKLEQIWQRNYDFCKNDCINKKIFKIFEIFLAHSTRLDKPEKTALAEFLRFLALKKVFSNHLSHILCHVMITLYLFFIPKKSGDF